MEARFASVFAPVLTDAEAGLALCQRRVTVAPEEHFAHADLGTVLQRAGRIKEAAGTYQRALALRPQDLATRSGWLFCGNYLAAQSGALMCQEARTFGQYASAQAETWRRT